jgi:hypothetical protein
VNNPHDCARFHYLIGGCKFEPRYDEKRPAVDFFSTFSLEGMDSKDLCDLLKHGRVYVHDICVRCGKITKRDAAPRSPEEK